MPADDRRIVIELRATEVGEPAGANEATQETSDSTNLTSLLKTIQHPVASFEKAILGKSILLNQIYQGAKDIIKDAAFYQLGYYFNLSENYKAEQTLNNTMNIISRTAGMASAVIGGAILVGPAGAVVGGTVAVGKNILSAVKVYNQQNLNITQMNMQSAFQQTRLGLVDDGRGTMN